ncbi:MAG: lipoate--protein ligase [Desulfovibrionales bacterium]|nr:lipoate--protein ligase [Desulfovibrionales bacterium]
MRYIENTVTDPAFNMAAEEWLLTETDDEVFMLWRNEPCILIGRNQNTLSQIDERFVRDRNIPVVRRMSGGGAVFNDLGNVNFTFIANGSADDGLDFQRFTTPILKALRGMGVACSFEGRNDLLIDGKKFSGNAQHMHKNRILHHGTLLFSADMADLSGALRVDPEKFRDKAVKSVTSRVTNIASHLPSPMSVTEFIEALMTVVSQQAANTIVSLSDEEVAAINGIADARYRTWDWNFGRSPAYDFTRTVRTSGGLLEVHLEIEKGRITSARLFGDYFGIYAISDIEQLLEGCLHDRTALEQRLAGVSLDEYMMGVSRSALVDALF